MNVREKDKLLKFKMIEVQYKFALTLIMLEPIGTMDAWTTTKLNLDARHLIATLM
jgi:hypothetical protein